MDGELREVEAQRVAALTRTDPAWRATAEQFRAVDRALDSLPVPHPRRSLAGSIVRAARRRQVAGRILRIAAPLAAAAAIVLAVWAGRATRTPVARPLSAIEQEIAQALPDVDPADRFIVVNLPLFEQYPDVESYRQVRDVADAETLAALAGLEADGGL